jgi:hypothetical protein
MASSATLALNSAVKRLRVFMSDGPSRRWTHFSSLSQEPAPALLEEYRSATGDGRAH